MSTTGFSLFDTPIGRCGIGWNASGIATLALPEAKVTATRARLRERHPEAKETTPPKDVDSDRLVLKYVAKHEGAFGVVKADAAKGVEGVRVLFEF